LGVEVALCPSSDDLRLVRRFAKGGSGSSGVRV
jgi:3-keto-5-aminohexanoate cleavage enzyme